MIQVVKYLLEGLAVALASHLVAGNKLDIKEIALLGVTAAAIFLVLEHFSPSIAASARQGAGFGIGHNLVNEGYHDGPGLEVGHQHGGYYYDDEEDEISPGPDPVAPEAPSANTPYKLVDGIYSAKVLLAGFNENAKAYNNDANCKSQSSYPWGGNAGGQSGGAGEEASEMEAVVAPQTQEEAETEAQQAPQIERDDNYRKADALYSGDLIDLTADGNYIQRGTIDSQIIFDKALAKVGTNLSKLRLVHPKHSSTKQTILTYGEPVYVMHNAYFNNMNQGKFIKYGEKLQSHQDGPLFRAFKIYDADNKEKKGPIEPGTELYICRGDQEGDNVYLKVESDKTVTSKNPTSSATRFTINLKRVFESHDRNLCVCPNEIIYP
jgi:hypothetical protein